jgi:hypothetical protein
MKNIAVQPVDMTTKNMLYVKFLTKFRYHRKMNTQPKTATEFRDEAADKRDAPAVTEETTPSGSKLKVVHPVGNSPLRPQ